MVANIAYMEHMGLGGGSTHYAVAAKHWQVFWGTVEDTWDLAPYQQPKRNAQ